MNHAPEVELDHRKSPDSDRDHKHTVSRMIGTTKDFLEDRLRDKIQVGEGGVDQSGHFWGWVHTFDPDGTYVKTTNYCAKERPRKFKDLTRWWGVHAAIFIGAQDVFDVMSGNTSLPESSPKNTTLWGEGETYRPFISPVELGVTRVGDLWMRSVLLMPPTVEAADLAGSVEAKKGGRQDEHGLYSKSSLTQS